MRGQCADDLLRPPQYPGHPLNIETTPSIIQLRNLKVNGPVAVVGSNTPHGCVSRSSSNNSNTINTNNVERKLQIYASEQMPDTNKGSCRNYNQCLDDSPDHRQSGSRCRTIPEVHPIREGRTRAFHVNKPTVNEELGKVHLSPTTKGPRVDETSFWGGWSTQFPRFLRELPCAFPVNKQTGNEELGPFFRLVW
jgi:hypothetical protein